MNGVIGLESSDDAEFVEVDPSGRYGRYNEVLGKGSSKTVYRAFDEYEGIEVAWNQVKLYDFLQSPEDLERLYSEIHLLKTLKHNNIMKFYTSWVDTTNMNINFVTEMFTSGTLRQYRLKHRRVNIRAVKHWCRQILKGLLYLHSRDPPIIHRDLKCDNIFINGNQGEVKIGDLGLAAVLRKSHAARCVGTPEFMAPEVYAEEYNELVDIYSFGMCILEMVTFEYPYSECSHSAQIYKKVMSGKKPDALYKVKDPEVCRFVEKCLASVSHRLSAWELLNDPFLQVDDYVSDLRPLDYCRDFDDIGHISREPLLKLPHSNGFSVNGYSNYLGYEERNDLTCHSVEYEADELDLFASQDDDHIENVDITIKGRRREDDGIFLRLRIADKEGRVRNIYFPFDIENDTALSVATEMVAELDITDQDVTKIADMIDGEIASLVPEWKRGFGIEESLNDLKNGFCHNCVSSGSLVDYLPSESPGTKNLQVLQCSRHGCGAVHGRFEEITYKFDGSERRVTDGTPLESNQSGSIHYADIWAQRDGPELSSQHSSENHSGDENETPDQSVSSNDERAKRINKDKKSAVRPPLRSTSAAQAFAEDHENQIRRELRWLKAKYQLQMRELRDQQLGVASKSPGPDSDSKDDKEDKAESASISPKEMDQLLLQSFASGKPFTTYFPADAEKKLANLKIRNYEAAYNSCSPEHMLTAKSFYTGTLLPHSLHRATSLPVDATDF